MAGLVDLVHLDAVERGENLPDDVPTDDAADLDAARRLFAARGPMP